jgi:hypothetical protein
VWGFLPQTPTATQKTMSRAAGAAGHGTVR